MEAELKNDPKVRAANARIDEYPAKTLEKEDRKRAKKEHVKAEASGDASGSTNKSESAAGGTFRGTTTADGGE